MNFFDRLSNGWKISMHSFKMLKENKQLIIFPILSGIAVTLLMGSFLVAIMGSNGWDFGAIDPDQQSSVSYYLMLFAFYIINNFVVVFFNMALIHCTRLYFKGEAVSVRAGLQFSMSRIGAIFAWSFFAATVGLILKAIQENSGVLGKFIAGFLGVVWSIATFFVVPVIAYEKLGPLGAFKRSVSLMKQKWGESLAATFSFVLIQLVGIILIGLPLFLIGNSFSQMTGIILAVAGVFIVVSIISSVQTIFVSAIYHNINGDHVEHFNQQMVDQLFQKK